MDSSEGSSTGIRSQRKSTEILSYERCVYKEDIVKCKRNGLLGIVRKVAGHADSSDDEGGDYYSDEEEYVGIDFPPNEAEDEGGNFPPNEDEDEGGNFPPNEDEDEGGNFPPNEDEDEGGNFPPNEDEDEGGNFPPNEDEDEGGNFPPNEDADDSLKDGQVKVLWLGNAVTTNSLSEITVVDRGFMFGNIVSSITHPTGQLGVVVGVHISVDLLSGGTMMEDVPSKVLKRAREFTRGDYVVCNHWVGFVYGGRHNLTIRFDNGTYCKIQGASPFEVKPDSHKTLEDANFSFHPGQRVRVTVYAGQILPRWYYYWLDNGCPANGIRGTVTEVDGVTSLVNWNFLVNRGFGSGSSEEPHGKQESKDLTHISCFTRATWELGDWCLLSPDYYVRTIEKKSSLESASCSNATLVTDSERTFQIVNKKTKVDVIWQNGSKESGLDSTTLILDESEGADFFPGQFVVKKTFDEGEDGKVKRVGVVSTVNAKDRMAHVRWLKPITGLEDPSEFDNDEFVSVYELEIHPHYDYDYAKIVFRWSPSYVTGGEPHSEYLLSGFGFVTGLGDGDVTVSWADGTISKVGPQAIYSVGFTDLSSASWKTSDGREDERENDQEVPLVGGMVPLACYDDDSCSFKNFDTSTKPTDHHYSGVGIQNIRDQKWLRKIYREWRILEKNLPDQIYVRVYEDKMDLMRAVIVGAFGTPYQDGLFFFDFMLPDDYPQKPPEVHYHSHGLRINPNLIEDGTICLSLLKTHRGLEAESWNPTSSSILQVLVSLQGLVLNSEPYLNEDRDDELVGTLRGKKRSLDYNEKVFLLNCKTILSTLQKPPKGFEKFVLQHFKTRGPFILKACHEYMNGSLVGSLTANASKSEMSGKDANTGGFKMGLRKMVSVLVCAFRNIGVDCQQYEHLGQGQFL